MRVLGLCLLAALCLGMAEGIVVTKCELKDQVTNAISHLSEKVKQKGLILDNLLAKIICHVELGSGFNTATVTQLVNGKRRAAPAGVFSVVEYHLHNRETPTPSPPPSAPTLPPHSRTRRHASPTSPGPTQSSAPTWTLYGLFQLSNHLVCSDGSQPSPNICEIDCNKLIDDDVQDDIGCLLTLFAQVVESGFNYVHFDALHKMIRLILQEECINVDASSYFAECP